MDNPLSFRKIYKYPYGSLIKKKEGDHINSSSIVMDLYMVFLQVQSQQKEK